MRRWEATSRQTAVLVGGAAVLTGGYLALPVDAVRSAVWLVAGLATAAAVLAVTHREGVEDRVPGWLLAAGLSLLTLGQAIEVSGQVSGSPSYADLPRPARLRRRWPPPSPPSSATGSGTTGTACSTPWS